MRTTASRWGVAMSVATFLMLLPTATGAGASSWSVRSTLTGKTALPHRIRWLGIPSLPSTQIAEVDFLIDGKLRWREQHAPYTYGNDGNYLVTSWLPPGPHLFTVNAVARDHERATRSVKATIASAETPPAALAGTWHRQVSPAESGDAGPPGNWRLTINRVGWRFRDPGTHGAFVDVAYLKPNVLEGRGGIFTGLDLHGVEGNIWCDAAIPVRYHWSVAGNTLTITLTGSDRCGSGHTREHTVWVGDWTRG